ncbi:DUF6055 domain-containing protein [Planomonospora sp. ID82291]|uniref:DUF6055 domain-containing protein n=1 Tax=Planomonospora sp. ID82291 TaxID=2738136 RepID=UPI0018C3D14E|nr:DUF6055 domain-containing protein [Planomonospora sp. ID82291]MBG0814596.1 avirulence protein [Planomonospora sp. ID82291]
MRRSWAGTTAFLTLLGTSVLSAPPATAEHGRPAVAAARSASALAKTVFIPERWAKTGEVPWVKERTKESANFVLLWGDKAGTDPTKAPAQYRFDPADVLGQLEKLYSFYVDTMRFTPETGLLAQHKIIVIVTTTWSDAPLDAWATGGSTDGKVGVINVAPGAAQPGSWGLAHELAHVFQNYTFLGRPGYGFTHQSAGTFWEASAEFMAMQVYPKTAAGDLTRFIRTENLAYSSSRHHYGAWMLLQYIKDRDGLAMVNRIWNEARESEHPLEVYRRVAGIDQAELNRRLGEYAQRNVTWDYSNRADVMPFINDLYPFVTAYNGVAVEAVNAKAGHFRIPDALAPGDYGYNKIRLVPSGDGGLIRLRFKGHVNAAAQSGWSYGFVAVKDGKPRYGSVHGSPDGEVTFQTQPGEKDVYLVVTGAPKTVHKPDFFRDGHPRQYRHPYQFRLQGAVPWGFEPGHVRPAAPGGGHWHSNGGGWVDNRANVAATAYVGPRAAVYGNATVTGNARIEDLAWVNSGATVGGNAVVKGNALVQGGARLSGSVVVGGDAEPAEACASGTYLMFAPDRGCDGRAGESDVNPSHPVFSDDDLAFAGGTTPTPTPTPTTGGTTTPKPTPTATAGNGTATPKPTPTAGNGTTTPKPTPTATAGNGTATPKPTPTTGGGTPTPTPTTGGGTAPVNLATAAKASASYTSPWESVAAINDGRDSDPRWGTWPETGTQWAELTWPSARTIRSAQVRFFDDGGGVRVPASWKLQYWNGKKYANVSGASGYGIKAGAYNAVTFKAVTTTRLRIVLKSGQASVGLLEVRAFG